LIWDAKVSINEFEQNQIHFERELDNIKITVGCFDISINPSEAREVMKALKHMIDKPLVPKDYWKTLLVKKTNY